jgi:alkylation response protein AidB-like acyl-CoA dehydrogenase
MTDLAHQNQHPEDVDYQVARLEILRAIESPRRIGTFLEESLPHWLPAPWVDIVRARRAGDLREAAGKEQYERWYQDFAATGLVVPRWPTRAGGLGLAGAEAGVVEQALAAHGVVRLGPFELSRVGEALARWGSEPLNEACLPGILHGREAWCQLFSEPGAGSDLPSLSTTASPIGDDWRVSGQKVWTSGADSADYGLLLARTSPEQPKRRGLSCFVVDMKQPGIVVRPLRQMTGDSSFNEVFLDDVIVPEWRRLGAVDDGWTIARAVLLGERRGISGSGAAEPLSFDFQVDVPRLLGPADAGRDSSRQDAARLYAIQRTNEWRNRRLGSQANPAWASLGKLAQSELNQRGHERALMGLGLRAVAWEWADSRALEVGDGFLRSRANTIEGGTSEIHRNAIAEGLLGLPREPDPFHQAPWTAVPR